MAEKRDAPWEKRKAALLLAVGLIAAALGILAHTNHLLRRPELQTVDARFQIRGTDRSKVAGLVVVGVDDATFDDFRNQNLHAQWPFPRRYHARVIDQLRHAGAKVIAFDVQFTEQTDAADDNALIEAVGRAHNVVLSTTEVGPGGTANVLGGEETLKQLGARAGNTSVIPDSDGVYRNTQYSIDGLKTFGVTIAEADTGHPVSASLFGGARQPVPIDFAGPPGTVPAISYSRVYNGQFPHGTFAGKIVIVGASASTLQDIHQTPTSGSAPMTGPEILANSAATVLAGIPLREPPELATVLLIVLLALLASAAGGWLGTLGVGLAGFGVLALWSLATQLAFDSGVNLDYSDPVASLLLATSGTVILGLWADTHERKQLRKLFAAGESGVIEQVLHAPGERPLEPTAIIAGYRIEQEVGRGGMGVVYRATQLALERAVAIKLIATDRAEDPEFRERFKAESRIAASIEHANVIPVYEAGEDDGLLFIAMRLVEGIDLARLISRGGPLEPARAARVIIQVAGALDAAHARGLVHRDVKPANVLLTLDDPEHAYLTDFGVAKYVGALGRITQAGRWVGTLDYVSPEQIRGEEVDASADIYALAGVLYRCVTGRTPFPAQSEAATLWAHMSATAPLPSRVRPDLPHELDVVIARGMAKEPAERFASAGALARACARAVGIAVAEISAPVPPPVAGHSAPGPSDSAGTMLSE